MLETVLLTEKSLSELTSSVKKYPQLLKNIKFDTNVDITQNDELNNAVHDAQQDLGSNGRIIVRPSGTEPLIRVMVEGENKGKIEIIAEELVNKVNSVAAKLH